MPRSFSRLKNLWMSSAAMISCSQYCIQRDCIVLMVISCLRTNLPIIETEGQSVTTGAVYAARSITFSAVPFGAGAATRLNSLPLSCVVSFKECQQDIWQKSWASVYRDGSRRNVPECRKTHRRRGNKRKGRGTMENDRPPISGIVGRTSGQVRLVVCDNTQRTTIQPQVEINTEPRTSLYTDECSAYNHTPETGRGHATVCHSRHEWARDNDGDGVREVHCNTMEDL
jgi:transposase